MMGISDLCKQAVPSSPAVRIVHRRLAEVSIANPSTAPEHMPNTDHLSPGRARSMIGILTSVLLLAACSTPPTDPEQGPDGSSAPVDTEEQVVSVAVHPSVSLVGPGDTLQFKSELRTASGGLVEDSVDWTAEEGQIDTKGRFIAPDRPGKYRVIGRGRPHTPTSNPQSTPADTAEVTVTEDETELAATSIVVSPETTTLETGESRQFSASLRNSSGTEVSGAVSWQASGGSVDETGLYTAGSSAGSYFVTATHESLADSAVVTVSPPPANQAPEADFSFACSDLTCSFDGSASQDPDGSITSYSWVFGDGSSGSGATLGHTYSAAGTFQVVLSVEDGEGENHSRMREVTVTATADDPLPSGVEIAPGQSIQSAVNAHQPGTVFILKAGTHTGQQVSPKDDQAFHCEAGATLEGNGAAFAFGSYGNPGQRVTVKGCEITGYGGTEDYHGAIQGDNAVDWLIEQNRIHGNDEAGVRLGDGMRVIGNTIHHNGENGIGGYRSDDVLIEDNELYANGATGTGGNRGAVKIVDTRGPVMRGNNVHDNFGRGLWLDTEVYDAIIEGNLVEDNDLEGIWLEASCGGAVIRDNEVRRNGFGMALQAWPDRAGINVSNASDVLVEGNTVEDNQNGIGLFDATGYPSHACGEPRLDNVTVRNNHVRQSNNGAAGAAVDNSGAVSYTGIRFEGNTYDLGSQAVFRWRSTQSLSYAQWQAEGNQ